jgi:hypothetical protein
MEDITILKPKLSRLKLSGVLETLLALSGCVGQRRSGAPRPQATGPQA